MLSLALSSLWAGSAAFAPASHVNNFKAQSRSALFDMPAAEPATTTADNLPVIQSRGGAPAEVRYSDFLKLVQADKLEKVTFSADGTQLLGVDTEGVRLKIEALPNDPDLLTQLTSHKVCEMVSDRPIQLQEFAAPNGISFANPAVIFL